MSSLKGMNSMYTNPIHEIYKSIVPSGMDGFSAKHLFHYLERYVFTTIQCSEKTQSWFDKGKNLKNTVHFQAVSLFLFTQLDTDNDGLVGLKDIEVNSRKLLFWMSPLPTGSMRICDKEYIMEGQKRFRHISLLCGNYNHLNLQALHGIFVDKLPKFVPSRGNMAHIASLLLLHLISTAQHLPLSERIITQQDWNNCILGIHKYLHPNQSQIAPTERFKIASS